MRERDLNGRRNGEKLEGLEGGKTIIMDILYEGEKAIFNERGGVNVPTSKKEVNPLLERPEA